MLSDLSMLSPWRPKTLTSFTFHVAGKQLKFSPSKQLVGYRATGICCHDF